jgi:hypothetical protein
MSLGAAALGLLIVSAAAAAGQADRAPSRIILTNPEPGVFRGRVESKNARCEPRRTVVVYHDDDANGIDQGDYEIGTDRTNEVGRYEVVGSQPPEGDPVIARVARRKLGSLVCRGDVATVRALATGVISVDEMTR